MLTFTMRIGRALALDPLLFEEVEADTGSTWQALTLVLLSSLALGIGASGGLAPSALLVEAATGLVAWLAWALMTYYVGTRILPTKDTSATPGELLRTLGFSSAPGLLCVLFLVRPFRAAIFVLVAVWALATMVIAIRQALDFTSTARAIGVCVVGWGLMLAALAALGVIWPPALG